MRTARYSILFSMFRIILEVLSILPALKQGSNYFTDAECYSSHQPSALDGKILLKKSPSKKEIQHLYFLSQIKVLLPVLL